ncbi:iron ABC transporter permease [Shouchella sp. 1P09AA]|uniref:FecCD family ABC transporter permease n=1 Tax=unclassified Shouchella TaxID=2893065 RepID=UPI0039A1C64E
MKNKRTIVLKAFFVLSFFLLFFLAMFLGARDITWEETLSILTFQGSTDTEQTLQEIRYPRVIAAILVGAALSVSGAVMQGLTRNPLADPGLLGLTAGANLGLAICIAFFPSLSYSWMAVASFVGAAIGMGFVIGIGAANRGGLSPVKIVLAGAAVSAFLFALANGISLATQTSKNVTMWTAGGLSGTSWSHIQLMAPIILLTCIGTLLLSRPLTILSLNEEVAVGLGLRTIYIKMALFLFIIILTGAAVALVGNMAFLGLMIPHIVRTLLGPDYRVIIPWSMVVGATFMVVADMVGRTLFAPIETPTVSIIAVIGLPFFLYVVRKGVKSLS